MTFVVRELPKAKCDKRHILDWLFERSPRGASAWLDAYDQMVERLKTSADSYAAAQENEDLDLDVKQVFFKTKRGRAYRAVFHVDGQDVYILRVRGPGRRRLRICTLAGSIPAGRSLCAWWREGFGATHVEAAAVGRVTELNGTHAFG